MVARTAAEDTAYLQKVSSRIDAELRRRVIALRQHGGRADDLGEPDEVADRMLATLPDAGAWHELRPLYSTKGVSRLLGGISRQAVEERRRRGTILALRTADGVWVYPAYQFDDRNRVLEGLAEVLACFDPGVLDNWTLASMLVAPQPELSSVSIIEHLRAGRDLEQVLALCRRTNERMSH